MKTFCTCLSTPFAPLCPHAPVCVTNAAYAALEAFFEGVRLLSFAFVEAADPVPMMRRWG